MKVFLAYSCSHRWGGAYEDGASESTEHIIDADTDPIRLARRVNAHHALPRIIQFNRGKQIVIPAFAMKSEKVYGSGGGCDYYAWVEIREAPRVTTETCPTCDGTGTTPSADAARASNRYFNVRCEKCNGGGTVHGPDDTPDVAIPAVPKWERRQGMRARGGWTWGNWLPCTEAEAQRVTGLQSWQVRQTGECGACNGTGRMPYGFGRPRCPIHEPDVPGVPGTSAEDSDGR